MIYAVARARTSRLYQAWRAWFVADGEGENLNPSNPNLLERRSSILSSRNTFRFIPGERKAGKLRGEKKKGGRRHVIRQGVE